MNETLVIFQQGLWLIIILSAPPLIISTVLGLLVSILQALTQVQEQTVGFVVKLVSVGVVLALTGHWMGGELVLLAMRCIDQISSVGR